MVIGICIYSGIEPVLKLKTTLEKLGHSVSYIFTDHYHHTCSYCMKKLDECGVHYFRRRFENIWKQNFITYIDTTKPDLILYVNAPTAVLHPRDMEEITEHCKSAKTKQTIWFVDTIFERDDLKSYYPYFDDIYVYEKQDVVVLQTKYKIKAQYVPVGFNDIYENFPVDVRKERKYDIFFVGGLYKRRLTLLNEVAKASLQCGWKLKVVMPLYEKRYFYKNILLRYRYPHLIQVTENKYIDSAHVARLYSQSKIVLNIHNDRAQSLNPRTFEIMSIGAFCLVDSRTDYDDIVVGKDLDIYHDVDELIEKIKLYLANDELRNQIADNGRRLARKKYSMAKSLRIIIK